MLDAGRYFLKKQKRSVGFPDSELIKIAVKSMGLDELYPFKPEEKIIEYQLEKGGKRLVDLTIRGFADETSSESPAPGGGSVAAVMGAMGVALGTMVANLSSHKRGWGQKWEQYSEWAEKGRRWQDELIHLVDADTEAFNSVMAAFGLPNTSANEKNQRERAIQEATKEAIGIPFRVMEVCLEALSICREMALSGNPNSVSDAGVGALALRSAIKGAYLNVRINVPGLDDKRYADKVLTKGASIEAQCEKAEKEIQDIVNEKLK
jgi:glutamate formiminotransferase/formiminotetrahydrofolate cyclodeaminase